jgi:hypothetical protein
MPKGEYMKLTIKEILEASPILKKITSFPLSAKVSYNIVRNMRKIEHEIKPFEESRLQLVHKYGKESEDGKISVTEENLENFYRDVASLLEEEVEVDIRPIKIDQLEEVKLTPNEIQFIDFFLEKEPE